nr:hypothetical protein [Pseudomonas sp.]
MTNEEKRALLMEVGTELYKANQFCTPDKVLKAIAARDAIRDVLAGTVGSSCIDWFLEDIAPWCQPFDDERMLKMAAFAGSIAEGKRGLVKGYPVIFATALGL